MKQFQRVFLFNTCEELFLYVVVMSKLKKLKDIQYLEMVNGNIKTKSLLDDRVSCVCVSRTYLQYLLNFETTESLFHHISDSNSENIYPGVTFTSFKDT